MSKARRSKMIGGNNPCNEYGTRDWMEFLNAQTQAYPLFKQITLRMFFTQRVFRFLVLWRAMPWAFHTLLFRNRFSYYESKKFQFLRFIMWIHVFLLIRQVMYCFLLPMVWTSFWRVQIYNWGVLYLLQCHLIKSAQDFSHIRAQWLLEDFDRTMMGNY